MRLFDLLRIYRAFKAYKLKEMAEQIGISPRQLSALEDGKTPDGETMAKVINWGLGSDEIKKEVAHAGNSSAPIEAQGLRAVGDQAG